MADRVLAVANTLPPWADTELRTQLQPGESVVWAAPASRAGYTSELKYMVPLCLFGGVLFAGITWYFFSWAQELGALGDTFILKMLAICLFGTFGFSLVPLFGWFSVRREWAALTDRRLIVRQARFALFGPRWRSVEPSQLNDMRAVDFPGGHGTIQFGWMAKPDYVGLTYVPEVLKVEELIRQAWAKQT